MSSLSTMFMPESEIMLEARFSDLQQLLASTPLTACMPLSAMALSAMLTASSY